MTRRRPSRERELQAAGGAALEVEVALGKLAASVRGARAELRRLLAGSTGWSTRGAWSSAHPSLGPGRLARSLRRDPPALPGLPAPPGPPTSGS